MAEQGTPTPAEVQKHTPVIPHLVVAPSVRDEPSGALFVLDGYKQVIEPFAAEAHKEEHIPPIRAAEGFGDVASWASYVLRFGFGRSHVALLTWNSAGLRAVLDYHGADREPGRCQWTATHNFRQSEQLAKWSAFISQPRDQKAVIEFLEDMAETIISPSAADITGLLSTLRSNVSSKSEVTLRPDGGASVEYAKESKVTAKGEIPPMVGIRIPVLGGHTTEDGAAVLYDLGVRMRVTPADSGAVFRFSIPNLTATLEAAYADRVNAAKEALGEAFPILRAANG